MVCDTGAEVSIVTRSFAVAAGLTLVQRAAPRFVRTPAGRHASTATTTLPLTIQLMLDCGGALVHWDRSITLCDVWVVDFGGPSPLDLYVSYSDWDPAVRPDGSHSPLGQLAHLVLSGITVLDSRRVPSPGTVPVEVKVVHARDHTHAPRLDSVVTDVPLTHAPRLDSVVTDVPPPTGGTSPLNPLATPYTPDADLLVDILARFPESKRNSAEAKVIAQALLRGRALFGENTSGFAPAPNATLVEFDVVKEPTPVSFQARRSRHVSTSEYTEVLSTWERLKQIVKVPHDTPAYGFAFLVKKGSGGWRLTISPKNINEATRPISPRGGFMPPSMLREVDKMRHKRYVITLDLRDAFLGLLLGPNAQRLSTFTTPVGKYRWRVGWFGWHSFPAVFQQTIMEKVVLPTLDEHSRAAILAWIDDLVLGADTLAELLAALQSLIAKLLAIGARAKLSKCRFLPSTFDWCGLEIDTERGAYRVHPDRVSSLMATPTPTNRDALESVLGTIRYYYFIVKDQHKIRDNLVLLDRLVQPGVFDISGHWSPDHERALRESLRLITEGNWLALYDPAKPLFGTTDAAGKAGYACTAYQIADNGEHVPIFYFSHGWEGKQATWPPQVKEAFAQRQFCMVHLRKWFPHATVILLCDNKNLSSLHDSADPRVQRYQFDIETSGAILRHWIPGEWNTIADYGSRSVVPSATPLSPAAYRDATLFSVLEAEPHLFSFREGEGDGPISVPGHITIAPMTEKIAQAQRATQPSERETWVGADYKSVRIGAYDVVLYRNRVLVPHHEQQLKQVLMSMCHDDSMHVPGGERTLWTLQHQMRVHWVGIDKDVNSFIGSCHRCQFAKSAPHGPQAHGSLNPSMAPYPHHTWYIDLKGEMPGGGYILVLTDGFSRMTYLRKCDNATSANIIPEVIETAYAAGTFPVVIRSDGGSTFTSEEFRKFCADHNITHVVGVAHHHQGQGMVETRNRSLAEALIASLGHKAPGDWNYLQTLPRLEFCLNSTYCEGPRGSPYWVLHGREPRTPSSAQVDSTSPNGIPLSGLPRLDAEAIQNLIAEHHSRLNAAQGRASMATCLAQALTKFTWDSSRKIVHFKVGDIVIIHYVAPNKMLPHFMGPYTVTSVSRDDNFVHVQGWIDPSIKVGPVHVSRVLPFDASRTGKGEMAEFLAGNGIFVIASILDHRVEPDGSRSYHIRWRGTPVTTWQAEKGLADHVLVREYRELHGLPSPAVSPATATDTRSAALRRRPPRRSR